MPKMMSVVKVAGDGDCLFHALAFFDAYDGGALRIDVAEFMEAHAQAQIGYEGAWHREATKLRASKWGGHTVIVAYSLMKRAKVMLHTHREGEATTSVEEVCHMSINASEAARAVHILYNGVDHYDALMEITNMGNMAPAWPQPPPPVYFCSTSNHPDVEFPALPAARGKQPGKKGLTAPRPADKRSKAKRAAKNKPAASKTSRRLADAEAPPEEVPREDPVDGSVPPSAPLHADEENEDEAQPGLMEALESIPVAETSLHPHRQVEDLIKDPTRQRKLHG